jgi:hypothetical protein
MMYMLRAQVSAVGMTWHGMQRQADRKSDEMRGKRENGFC